MTTVCGDVLGTSGSADMSIVDGPIKGAVDPVSARDVEAPVEAGGATEALASTFDPSVAFGIVTWPGEPAEEVTSGSDAPQPITMHASTRARIARGEFL